MARWGMVIDLRKCLGCESCAIACGEANRVPKNTWRRVNDCGVRSYPDRQRRILPLSCQQCAEAPCLQVCPTGATSKRADGVVEVEGKRCIGCGYCIVACPYRARSILDRGYEFEVEGDSQKTEADTPESSLVGVCTKCNFCRERVESGLARNLSPGQDREATPMCVISCSAGALHFGDLDDPDSEVSRLIRDNHTVRLREDLGTDPSVTYIVPETWTELPQETDEE